MLKPNITQDEQDYRDDTYSVSRKCLCGTVTSARVDGPGLFLYNRGSFVQTAFPELDVNTREALFISGYCSTCWDSMFSDSDDDHLNG